MHYFFDKMIVKVCGMRDEDNIRALEKIDIDWIGFIFYEASPRYVPEADRFCAAIQVCSKVKVGVFVNEEFAEISRKTLRYRLNCVQLHGDETPELCRQVRCAGYTVIKAFSISSEADLLQTVAYEPFADYFLFDTKDKERGGTGKRFDWSILQAYQGDAPFLLSGGIAPEHLYELSSFRHPKMAGIDLNSRFELAPAIKDTKKIESFVHQFKKQ